MKNFRKIFLLFLLLNYSEFLVSQDIDTTYLIGKDCLIEEYAKINSNGESSITSCKVKTLDDELVFVSLDTLVSSGNCYDLNDGLANSCGLYEIPRFDYITTLNDSICIVLGSIYSSPAYYKQIWIINSYENKVLRIGYISLRRFNEITVSYFDNKIYILTKNDEIMDDELFIIKNDKIVKLPKSLKKKEKTIIYNSTTNKIEEKTINKLELDW
ncbi:MAG: hypothetical protein P1U44_01495 [Vicingaceae bacterium]|nr:hypothetical protein [Vicingaceae bacterium]